MFRKWMDHEASQWLETPLGESLLNEEARVVEEALDGVFGERRFEPLARFVIHPLAEHNSVGRIRPCLTRTSDYRRESANLA